jgi:hypothetical protein
VALGKLPDGRALRAPEFFSGYGESQSFDKLRQLGFHIVSQSVGGEFSREQLERMPEQDVMSDADSVGQALGPDRAANPPCG